MSVPHGVVIRDLAPHTDDRGVLVELFRSEWDLGPAPVQWNCVHSRSGTLRGVHVHPFHSDFLTVISGHLQLCVHDIRKDSPTCGHSALLSMTGAEPLLAFVPPGVAHGFYFAEPTTYVYGLTTPWSMEEEIGCRWDSPELGITWPVTNPVLSERDAAAGSYADMVRGFEAKQAAGRGTG